MSSLFKKALERVNHVNKVNVKHLPPRLAVASCHGNQKHKKTNNTSSQKSAEWYPSPPKGHSPIQTARGHALRQHAQSQRYMQEIIGTNAINQSSFVFPMQKITLSYCDIGGSSRGMRDLILHALPQWSSSHPWCEVIVQPRPFRHPLIRAEYDNGHMRTLCVRGMNADEIALVIGECAEMAGGNPMRLSGGPVLSRNESIRGIWSPFDQPRPRLTHKPQANILK